MARYNINTAETIAELLAGKFVNSWHFQKKVKITALEMGICGIMDKSADSVIDPHCCKIIL